MQAITELEREVNRLFMDIRRSEKEKERELINANLASIVEKMRKEGKNDRTIQKTLEESFEIAKARARMTAASKVPGTSKPEEPEQAPFYSEEMQGFLLSEVETREIQWLWEGRIPLGKITVLDGDPGLGKSLLAMNVAACVSTGQPMPDGTPGKQGNVVLIAPEDGAADTLKPRLEAAGGDPSRVLLLNTVEDMDPKQAKIIESPFSLSKNLALLEEKINQIKAILVILDPLMAVLGRNVASSRDQDIREIFTPLAQLAERTGCAILIIRHLNKRSSENLLYRGAGSIGIIGAARIGLIVAQDPFDEKKRVLATTKNNLSQKASNLIYQVVENERGVPCIHWLEENHYEIATFIASPSLSTHRQDIIRLLRDSLIPLGPKEIAERTELDYTTVRKILRRMHESRVIGSPSRGLYTALGHPSLETHSVTMEQVSQQVQVSQMSQPSHFS